MSLKLKKPNKVDLILLSIALLFIPTLFIVFKGLGIVFTLTGSVPIGFYQIVPTKEIHRGDFVSFCLPDKMAKLGLERGYINIGTCPNGSEQLIKEVIGIPGDVVTLIKNTIKINKSNYLLPLKHLDKNNLPVVTNIKPGKYKLKGYWVYGSGDYINSWDSRYYGPIPIKYINHKLKKLLTF